MENAFHADAGGKTLHAAVIATHVDGGGFHVKTAGLRGDRFYYATKTNANFPDNPSARGLPTVQGVISLHDATDGQLLALMDSMEVTSIRTAAATAVAAKFLARPDAHSVTMIGCGNQGRSHLRALSCVVSIDEVFAYDSNPDVALAYANDMSGDFRVTPVNDYRGALGRSDIVVTTTPSREPLLVRNDIKPGTFVAAVGADSEVKQEIAPDLLASCKLVVDVLDQCAAFGDLHHAIAAGAMSRDDVHAELAAVVSGQRSGRTTAEEVIVFDSTGTALEDVAAAAIVYERAISTGRGVEIAIGS